MARLPLITLCLVTLTKCVHAALETCGQAQYDPTQYVCWHNQFLCPIRAGEPLSYCGGACYSTFMYTCSPSSHTLALLPEQTTPFSLTVSNPTLPIHNLPVSAGGLRWLLGGPTSSYCPEQVGTACPTGTYTSMVASGGRVSMNVMVPGGQQAYLDPYWGMAYTQAHSAYIPPGSTVTGFVAYAGGGFVNLNGNGWGWVACPPRASGGGGSQWVLIARNETTAATLAQGGCQEVNLKVVPRPEGSFGAWQYT